MDRQTFVTLMNQKLKLVRIEQGFTQEQLATVLGLSKKTLVEIEKGRSSLGWMGAVTLASIFAHSEVLQDAFGGELSDMIAALAFTEPQVRYPRTMGGRIWWNTVVEKDGFRIQQNMVSRHYRLLDAENHRICASFELEAVEHCLQGLL